MQSNENYHQILNLIGEDLQFPSPPAVAVKILDAVQKDESALTELAEIISADPALTAKMLKVANSGIFTCNGEIASINRALMILGTNIIKNIALSFVIAENFNSNGHCGYDYKYFWHHSVTAAVAAELIAKEIGLQDDDLFVASLLQNIGMLVILQTKGEEYKNLVSESLASGRCLTELELTKYGYHHQQVGYALLADWKLPESITEPILFHHQPDKANEESRQSAAVLYFAHQIAAIYHSSEQAEKARLLQQELTERYQLDQAQALRLLDDAATQSQAMLTTFEMAPEEIKPYSVLLQEANNELAKLHLSNEQLMLEMKEAKEKAERIAHELEDANARLKELVYRDGLTGLYNHRYFQEALSKELARANRYQSSISLILFDIDHFKQVNDTHGHPAGDMVLMNISRAVSSAVRPSDIVARYGGEEFAVILPETNAAGVKVFAARLRRCVEGIATLVDGQLIYVTISSGATTFTHTTPRATKDILIDTADRGLYTSKQNGRNQVTVLELEPSEE
ncbi:MAG: HDOD domain-containing protein [Desulfuromonadales bacterium]|nr:HDOD domain-containing protein [Desulfuromonadales bacterium]MBN2793436.1 HDOD domain-containing protein [Desulfuromonadales bacterium]